MAKVKFDKCAGTQLAYLEDGPIHGDRCGLFWLGGFNSDMEGTKAEFLARFASESGRPFLRFDYSGHGKSGGQLTDGTITRWLAEARHMFTVRASGARIVIGSSMGGWLALLLLRKLLTEEPHEALRVAGLILIAPAVDMTADLMWDVFPKAARRDIEENGVFLRPSAYGDPYPITGDLIEDGRRHLLLHHPIDCPCPVRILQGESDADVPATHAVRLFETLRGADISLTLVKGGDHRLSQPTQLALIGEAASAMAAAADRVSAAAT
jgi:pimeloyl-ACP methyl ester carboxylesterase